MPFASSGRTPVSISLLLILNTLVIERPAVAGTLTVCRSGCTYADLQAAIDAAQPGDTVLLRAGETFVGHFVLPAKGTSGPPITITSDAPASSLPAAGVRLVPHGYPGGNTSPSSLARLQGRGGIWKTTPVIQAAPGAHYYRLQFLDIDGVAQEGWETLVEIGTSASSQSTIDAMPAAIVLDRVFVHGHAVKGQKRCIALNGRHLAVLNSYVVSCASVDFDAQAIGAFNGPGPYRIINNHLEGTGENIIVGGADPRIEGMVPGDIEIRGNYVVKPLAWRDPLLVPPSAPSASVAGGGSVGAGNYFFTVVAVVYSASEPAYSGQSGETAVSVGSSGAAVSLSWPGVAGADRYRVYVGTSPGGQNRYVETSGSVTSLTYDGTGESWSSPPSSGTRWNVKNLLELKNAERVLIDGNVFEHLWPASQQGYAILFTPRNEGGSAPWSVVRDVTFSNNVLRHVSGGINILGQDDVQQSQRTERITIRNNLVYDVSSSWGGSSHVLVITRSPSDVKLDHNTILHDGMVVIADDGASSGFAFTNNLAPHNTYGIFGSGAGTGSSALDAYFPGAVVRRNALGGGPASLYPPDNFFPDMATFMAQFVDPASADYRLTDGSLFRGVATDGRDLGVDFAEFQSAQEGVDQGGGDSGTGSGGGTGGGSGGDTGGTGGGGTTVAAPYSGTPVGLPGIIQAEDFDNGGPGVAYFDHSTGNEGGQYRGTDVDIATAADTGGGYTVGWVGAGEWLTYTLSLAAAGTYDIDIRVASAGPGGVFHIEVDGIDRTGPVSIPDTGGWQAWTTVRRTAVSLPGGVQTWRVVMDSNGASGAVGNFNHFTVVSAAQGAPPSPITSGGDIVLYAADVSTIAGNWARVGSWSGAGAEKMQSADWGWDSANQPLASPGDYFEASFVAEPGRTYRVWLRLRAGSDSKWNDSVWVQFSNAVDAGSSPLWRIGSEAALLVNLERCSGCGVSGWGWQSGSWWLGDQSIVRFPGGGTETIRVQIREDGVEVDQIVLSPETYFSRAPGAAVDDTTIVKR